MAADKQSTMGDMKYPSLTCKIRRGTYHGMPALFSGAGTMVYTAAVFDWLHAGMPDDNRPEMPEDPDSFIVMVATAVGVYKYIDSLRPIPIGPCKWAIGSGAGYAFGAMAAGASAKRAVEIACTFDVCSGMGIDVLSLGKTK